MSKVYNIGEFSKITGLSVKALRFYHEQGLLEPSSIDPSSGYRSYDESKIDKARVIRRLREVDFSVDDIRAMLEKCSDEADVLDHLERQSAFLEERMRRDRANVRFLAEIIRNEQEAKALSAGNGQQVKRILLPPMLTAGIRMTARYAECGGAFAKLGRAIGRYISGKPFCLYYDAEFREAEADFEVCFPVSKEVKLEGVAIRELEGGESISLLHKGAYDNLGRSYAKILRHAREAELNLALPTREVFLKGPGMIFRGNPRNYLTEIQLPLIQQAPQHR